MLIPLLSLSPTAVRLLTMATLVVLPIPPTAHPLLPLTPTDMAPLPLEEAATVVTLPMDHHTPMVEVGVTMVGVAMEHPLLAVAVVATMDDTNSTNNRINREVTFSLHFFHTKLMYHPLYKVVLESNYLCLCTLTN